LYKGISGRGCTQGNTSDKGISGRVRWLALGYCLRQEDPLLAHPQVSPYTLEAYIFAGYIISQKEKLKKI
jgi:hypothetical protein